METSCSPLSSWASPLWQRLRQLEKQHQWLHYHCQSQQTGTTRKFGELGLWLLFVRQKGGIRSADLFHSKNAEEGREVGGDCLRNPRERIQVPPKLVPVPVESETAKRKHAEVPGLPELLQIGVSGGRSGAAAASGVLPQVHI